MGPIKFDVNIPNRNFGLARAFAERADAFGFHSISLNDHFFMRGLFMEPRSPHLECYTTLAALAPLTHRVRLLQMVTSMSFRNPALLAKMTSTLDNICDGRLIVGVGAGWFREEYVAYNYPYPSNRERIEQLAEGVQILKKMWTEDEPTYRGRYFAIERAYNFPKPLQKPHPPLLIGGSGPQVLKISAAEADIANLIPPLKSGEADVAAALRFDRQDLGRRIELLRRYAREAGREPSSPEVSAYCHVLIGRDRKAVAASAQFAARALRMSNFDAAKQSTQIVVGTAEEVKEELAWRISNLGITYFVLFFLSVEALELFAREVMPAFV